RHPRDLGRPEGGVRAAASSMRSSRADSAARDCGDSVGDQFESALTSARSVTTKIYDRASGGAEHSQLGAQTLLQWRGKSQARPPRRGDLRPPTPAGESRAPASRPLCFPSKNRPQNSTAPALEKWPLSTLSP